MRTGRRILVLLCIGLLWPGGCSSPAKDPGAAAVSGEGAGSTDGAAAVPGGEAEDSADAKKNGMKDEDGAATAAVSDDGAESPTGAKRNGTDSEKTVGMKKAAGMETPQGYEGSMELSYAENFTVDHLSGGCTLLTTVMDGAKFLIVPEGGQAPEGLEEGTVVLRRPLKDIYLVASSAMDLFSELGGLDAITFSGQEEDGWYIEAARKAMHRGDIRYAGKYDRPDYEQIVAGNCSLAIENMMISHAPEVVENLESLGIPVMIDYSSYESHPLGRVEWVKFYGALLGREAEAEKIFAEQEEILERVSAVKKTDKTVAFFFITSNGLVQVRNSSDYVPKMIELAGGKYVFQDLGDPETKRSTVNMQVEEFYAGAKDADYLIYNSSIDGGVADVKELLAKCGPLADFKAVKEGNVWCTSNDLYQQSLSIGYLIGDIHEMLQGKGEQMHYLRHLD